MAIELCAGFLQTCKARVFVIFQGEVKFQDCELFWRKTEVQEKNTRARLSLARTRILSTLQSLAEIGD